jgi:hypothetical protein
MTPILVSSRGLQNNYGTYKSGTSKPSGFERYLFRLYINILLLLMVASGLEKVEGFFEANGEECLLAAFAKFIFSGVIFVPLNFLIAKKYKLL